MKLSGTFLFAAVIAACWTSGIAAAGTLPDSGTRESPIVKLFEPVCGTLDSLIRERTSVKSELELEAVMKRGGSLDFYFSRSLGDLPWTAADIRWFREELKRHLPEEYAGRQVGSIYSNRISLENLATPGLGFSGKPSASDYRVRNRRAASSPLVKDMQKPAFSKGMDNMHIALWQSHGRYYEQGMERWEWQRPCLFQTAEDLFTQSFVVPFLVPMLENAGACVLLPRERDMQTNEVIIDNDPSFERVPDMGPVRYTGKYTESGKWADAGTGFADTLRIYEGLANPFEAGTARMAECVRYGKKAAPTAEARWIPDIPERGEYAVYVSYKSLPNSTSAARYTVRHLGGESTYIVNQKMGGGTWIYLGTHEFAEGRDGYVALDNMTPEGSGFTAGSVVSADAVKIGGGMGNIARKAASDTCGTAEVSGLPRFVEGARYWLQWAGADSSIFSQNGQKNDYMDDFMSRGAWVSWLSAGSPVNPDFTYPPAVSGERKSLDIGKGIPVDLSFGFHSDAGTTPDDSTVGTLAIYTLKCETGRRLPDGENRMTSREYAYLVQSQIVHDIRAEYAPDWNRRWLWDRSYSECRTPSTPAMLLELMSHQNFADMRYGLDPAFRFTVSRAVYKGILKYLGNRYDREYAVQPLPVRSFAAVFADNEKNDAAAVTVRLSWTEPVDTLEPTAVPEGYILYTRTDDGAFDNGRIMKNVTEENGRLHYDTDIEPGHIYSYRITAYNSGGESFPSETLGIGVPAREGEDGDGSRGTVLVVNNFDRISAPVSFDTPQYAGFDNRTDSGVPYMKDISFSGEMYQFRRDMQWTDDDNPGFGASDSDFAGKVIAGNTFDYPYVHGKAIMKAGYPFCSASSAAFTADSTLREGCRSIDLICGKQVTVKIGNGSVPDRYRVFPAPLQDALRSFTARGGNVLVSGANIGTDIWDRVYEVECDSVFRAASMSFAEEVLGYKWITGFASKKAGVKAYGKNILAEELDKAGTPAFSYNNEYDSRLYRVEAPDGLAPVPAGKGTGGAVSGTFLRYADTGISAGTFRDTGTFRTVAIGFPIETVTEEESIDGIISATLKFFER